MRLNRTNRIAMLVWYAPAVLVTGAIVTSLPAMVVLYIVHRPSADVIMTHLLAWLERKRIEMAAARERLLDGQLRRERERSEA